MRRVHKRLLLVLICVGVGIPVSVYGVMIVLDAYASTRWPTTSGTVISAEITRSRSRQSGTSYEPVIRYEFTVDGTAYEADRWTFRHAKFGSRGEADQIVAKYPPGAEVTVSYDPDEPSNAVLEPGAGFSSYLMLIFGIALLICGGVAALKVTRGGASS